MKQFLASELKSKPHYEVLDGLRGVAAVSIVVFHFLEFVYLDYSKNFLGHGFLAVDFFFCLSGFVIGYAYDDRVEKIGVWKFFKARLIRLHPLVILGAVFGLLGFLVDPFSEQQVPYSAGKLFLIFLSSIFLIPFPVMPERGFGLFGFNTPSWSLFFEYVANIFYVLFLYKMRRGPLLLLLTLSAGALCFVSYRAGTLIGGWDGRSFWDGCARISYSFLAGLLVYRFNWIIKTRIRFIGLSILLLLTFIVPYFKWNWLVESMIVLFYFPLLIAIGAGATLTKGYKKLCIFLGKISYPLYMTHIPAIWMFGNYYNSHQVSSGQLFFIVTIGTVLLFGLAYLVMVIYDIPIRKYLSNKKEY
ncbi:acyltransferase family protein [Olivibacter domesticus]|uniref:Peptidoglycan/LPS O-acetylase OafA/YrhL, contains acyltransferase and SGNH-hydrolase domains n=1 Tax=Olivibacter domesticus TaxID=407022 RepID=A0A1H7SA03_OLID1|nr:acyltransferase [Olivibacter domesticus]SEL69323.1 Peptidoglycan/LPS O-acetylase OafA/YrhL, contains acyltransferase and SGNH-hydrolase domains [Olivibacter domesticus]